AEEPLAEPQVANGPDAAEGDFATSAGVFPSASRPAEADHSAPSPAPTLGTQFAAPVLGWETATGEAVVWRVAGEERELDNGHTEIWGASGSGKTQFTMALLAQLAPQNALRFGIADFKNDYTSDGFPDRTGARFIDLWQTGAPFNPLALPRDDGREKRRAII